MQNNTAVYSSTYIDWGLYGIDPDELDNINDGEANDGIEPETNVTFFPLRCPLIESDFIQFSINIPPLALADSWENFIPKYVHAKEMLQNIIHNNLC